MSLEAGVHPVEIDGGALAVEVLAGTTEPVLAIHGVSSTRKLWSWLRQVAPEITLVAPDLRGRADSYDVKGASSIAQHAADMVAVLDHFGLDQVHVCGMSMGGFVAVELAHRHPERVKSLVLVDGGFPMASPPGLTREMVPALFADRLGRLEKRWDSLDEYADFFIENTAQLLSKADPLVMDYLAHDLKDGLVQLSGSALVEDATDIFFAEPVWQQLSLPIRFLHAQWGPKPGLPPGYSAAAAAEYAKATVDTRYVPEVDHASSIMSVAGASVTAELLRAALAGS